MRQRDTNMQNALHRAERLCARMSLCLILTATLMLTACRRDLWIYTDDLHQVELITDWSEATEQPGGMTWWFINDDDSGHNHHDTTADVTHAWLGLPKGWYSGVVFDYSPAEYAHQSFIGMAHIDSALVIVNPSADQPLPNEHLYGDSAVAADMEGIVRYTPTGMYSVAAEPETMNADTLQHVNIITGADGELILWEERDDYESQLVVQTLDAQPQPIVWRLVATVYVRGIAYMNSVRASVAGLTDGCWLGSLRHTSTPCLQALDEWTRAYTAGDSIGFIRTAVNTFGLTDPAMPPSPADTRVVGRASERASAADYLQRLRLNLLFLLRDQATTMAYHYDLDDDHITVDDENLVIYIDIPIDFKGGPNLPFVDDFDGTGFDATVTPWADGGSADATM